MKRAFSQQWSNQSLAAIMYLSPTLVKVAHVGFENEVVLIMVASFVSQLRRSRHSQSEPGSISPLFLIVNGGLSIFISIAILPFIAYNYTFVSSSLVNPPVGGCNQFSPSYVASPSMT
jgi:hypothetical protein